MYILLIKYAWNSVFFLSHHYIAMVEVTQLKLVFPVLRLSLQLLDYVRH